MICVDASVALKWIFPEEYSAESTALYANAISRGERLIAPALIAMEFANVVRKKTLREGLDEPAALAALDSFEQVPIQAPGLPGRGSPSLHHHALALSIRFNLPAVYDAYYLALAELNSCPFWTADRRLVDRLGAGFPLIRWIGDFRNTA